MPRRNHRRCREQAKTHTTRREKKKDKGNGQEENHSIVTTLLSLIQEENRQNRKLGFKKSTVCRSIIAWLEENYDSRGGDQFIREAFNSAEKVGESFPREYDRLFYADAVMISTMAFLLWDDNRDHLDLVEELKPELEKKMDDCGLLTLIERKLRARKKIANNQGGRRYEITEAAG